jgi:hypothetical protein
VDLCWAHIKKEDGNPVEENCMNEIENLPMSAGAIRSDIYSEVS